jgi:hypothetical protein
MNGLESPHKLLTEYIFAHTDFRHTITDIPHASDEPELQAVVDVVGFKWEKLRKGMLVLQLRLSPVFMYVQIVQSHMTKGLTPCFDVTKELVESGIARLRDVW